MQWKLKERQIKAICIIATVYLIIISISLVFDFQPTSSKTKVNESTSSDLSDAGMKSKNQVRKFKKPIPSDPSKYGIEVKAGFPKPETQEQLNIDMNKMVLDSLQGLDMDSRKEIFASIEEDPKQTEEKIKRIDSIISECDAKLAENPQDLEVKARKERLMMLKAIANSFEQQKL